MNKGIAHILYTQLLSLPFIDRFGGLVSTQEQPDSYYDDESKLDKRIVRRYPATRDFVAQNGEYDTDGYKDFIPDQSKTGLLYFEDRGMDPLGREGKYRKYRSRLRMVVWLNTERLVDNETYQATPTHDVPGALMNSIEARLGSLTNQSQDGFIRLVPQLTGVLIQDKSIFSSYTYDLYGTQYLMLPYEYFAMDYSVEFRLKADCLPVLATADPDLTGILYDANDTTSFVTTGDNEVSAYQATNS